MARTISLSTLRSRVISRADIVDGGTDGRHPTAELNASINQAIQQFRRLVTDCGNTIYVKPVAASTATSATPDAAGWAPRDYLALPNDFYHLEGIDIVSGGTTVPMIDYMQSERNMFKIAPAWLGNQGVGMPVFYKLGGANAAGAALVKVIPSADSVYACTIWYLSIPADLVADGDLFDGIAGYEEWVVNRAAMDVMLRDQASQPLYNALAAENGRLEAKMCNEFASATGAGRRVDTRAMREYIALLSRGYWRFT